MAPALAALAYASLGTHSLLMQTTTAKRLIDTAAKHMNSAAMASSARLCVDDARSLLESGDARGAARRAVDSLKYSVGIFGADYQEAARQLD